MERASSGQKSICIPISEEHYNKIVGNTKAFRSYLDEVINIHPELFPPQISEGYRFNGTTTSSKLDLSMHRIQLLSNREVYQLRPDFVMPYMIGLTDEVEKALYLRRYGVPYEALAYVFGKDAMYWYRANQALGRYSIVGTTIKDPQDIPVDLVADEKHSWLEGERIYLPTTVAQGCILGVDVVESASIQDLQQGYSTFQAEAKNLNLTYCPETVNTDGWQETQAAWKLLFPMITVVLCFLHSVLAIQDHLRRSKELFAVVSQKLWNLYHAASKEEFAQELAQLLDWANPDANSETLEEHPLEKYPTVREKLQKLQQKAPQFEVAYDHPGAYRTSNALDRLMNYQDRVLYAMQYFHGTLESARLEVRAMALIWNFHPYGARTLANDMTLSSPFEDLNGFCYHDNWLHNLLIAGSMNGYRCTT